MKVPYEMMLQTPTDSILLDLKYIEYLNKIVKQKQQAEQDNNGKV